MSDGITSPKNLAALKVGALRVHSFWGSTESPGEIARLVRELRDGEMYRHLGYESWEMFTVGEAIDIPA